MRFGPAGIPIGCKGGTKEGVEYTAELGLSAFEVEFVRGVKMRTPQAREVGDVAKQKGIVLSAHCPYWINTCARDPVKLVTTKRNILQTARAVSAMGGGVIVFHPGYYMGRDSGECMKISVATLRDVKEEMKAERLDATLGLETTGGPAEFGTLEECIQLANEIGGVPVIDFAHIHARNGEGILRKKEDYLKIFHALEKGLDSGPRYVKNFHSHFSEIEYGKRGEIKHIPLGKADEPPFRPLAEVIKEHSYDGTIISESPLLEEDALKMKKIFEGLKR